MLNVHKLRNPHLHNISDYSLPGTVLGHGDTWIESYDLSTQGSSLEIFIILVLRKELDI